MDDMAAQPVYNIDSLQMLCLQRVSSAPDAIASLDGLDTALQVALLMLIMRNGRLTYRLAKLFRATEVRCCGHGSVSVMSVSVMARCVAHDLARLQSPVIASMLSGIDLFYGVGGAGDIDACAWG